jgi:hypothetical protein
MNQNRICLHVTLCPNVFCLIPFTVYLLSYIQKYSSRPSVRCQGFATNLYLSVTFRSWNPIFGVIFSAVGAECSRVNKWSVPVSSHIMPVRSTVHRPCFVGTSSPMLVFKSQQLPMHSLYCCCQNISHRAAGIHLSRNIKLPSCVQQSNRFRERLQWRWKYDIIVAI